MFWKRFFKPAATDGVIDLYPLDLYPPEEEMGFGEYEDYIITVHGSKREAGQISLRTGESECVYYFGHIGYHVDPPWRGHHYAERACRLLIPRLQAYGLHSVVITCDPDNAPSVRTCERLGCILENTVDVPRRLQKKWELSPVKRRYIWLPGQK